MNNHDHVSQANSLINETSPYLLQHAYNPVRWYAWSKEALEEAIKEDKPIFLSIGYSSCHWCHVMAHESFEDPEIAKIMNENYVNIKVDREERPDIDDIYQKACQLSTGNGGWPLSIFLTPEQKPFFVGTYFPKDGIHGMSGFRNILLQLSKLYRDKKEEVEKASSQFASSLEKLSSDIAVQRLEADIDKTIMDEAAMSLMQMTDNMYGGFGQAPKFPNSLNLQFLLRYYNNTRMQGILDFVILTANRMAAGGIYDQIGGGFSRYSTDRKWLVPHFEKMLYDNALLVLFYCELFQVTKEKWYKKIVEETLNFVDREMANADGGFFSALDADSEGEEGKFYIWSKNEITEYLKDTEIVKIFCDFYGVTEEGNFEGKNILNFSSSMEKISKKYSKTQTEIEKVIDIAKETLLETRNKRIRPGLDDKILTSWNGLMISAFIAGFKITQNEKYLKIAIKSIEFINNHNVGSDGHLLRFYKKNRREINGFIDDYTFYSSALIDAYQLTGNQDYLKNAKEIMDYTIEHFWDDSENLFFFTSNTHEKLIMRTKNVYDLAIPSGNSMAIQVLLKLHAYYKNDRYSDIASRIIRSTSTTAVENPFGFGQLLNSTYLYLSDLLVVKIFNIDNISSLKKAIFEEFIPNLFLQYEDKNGSDTFKQGEKGYIIVCSKENSSKINTIEELMKELRKQRRN